jgi:hypothetical protein
MSDAIQKGSIASATPGFDFDWHGLVNKCSAREEATFFKKKKSSVVNVNELH